MDKPSCVESFANLDLSEDIIKTLTEAGYEKPTPIQARAIPAIFSGRDIFGCAQTGTGKTAAFVLPIMQTLQERGYYPHPKQFRALILTPTRELAEQIASNIAIYGKRLNLTYCKVYGGVSPMQQIRALAQGVDIVVATPGRLLDLFRQKKLLFDSVEYLVLDEADRMLDMGFIPDIRKICERLPQNRQSLLFSATLSDEVQRLAHEIVVNPIKISVSPDKPTVEKIDQSVAFVERENKFDLLEEIMRKRLEKDPDALALVFTRTKHGADNLTRRLTRRGLQADAIHGDKSQAARQRALRNFKNRDVRILVATDIAARGIDVKDMSLVMNYDLPEEDETYVHRIGRTARAQADGQAISFCSAIEAPLLKSIERFIKREIPELTENEFLSETARNKARGKITKKDRANTMRERNSKRNGTQKSQPKDTEKKRQNTSRDTGKSTRKDFQRDGQKTRTKSDSKPFEKREAGQKKFESHKEDGKFKGSKKFTVKSGSRFKKDFSSKKDGESVGENSTKDGFFSKIKQKFSERKKSNKA